MVESHADLVFNFLEVQQDVLNNDQNTASNYYALQSPLTVPGQLRLPSFFEVRPPEVNAFLH